LAVTSFTVNHVRHLGNEVPFIGLIPFGIAVQAAMLKPVGNVKAIDRESAE